MSAYRAVACLGLAVAWIGLAPPLLAKSLSFDEVVQLMGYSDEQKKALIRGEIVATDLERTREDQLYAAVGTRLDEPLADLAENARNGVNIESDPGTEAFGVLSPEGYREELAAVVFPESARREINRLLRVRADGTFNLSKPEVDALRAALKDVKPGDAGAAAAVSKAYQDVLAGRVEAYLAKGLSGIADYDHGGDRLKPADQLQMIEQRSEEFFEQYYPEFGRAVAEYPKGQPDSISNRLYWIRRDVEGRPALVLAHQMVQEGEDFVLLSQRQFFVGHTYQSLQAYALLLPLENGSALFFFNSAFTDKVAGLFSGVAQSVGQGRLRRDLQKYIEGVREESQR